MKKIAKLNKIIISVLTVLLFSFVLFGCGDKPCEICGEVGDACICQPKGASDLKAITNKGDVRDAIEALGKNPKKLLTPEGALYYDYFASPIVNEKGTIAIYWTRANKAMYDYYLAAWLTNRGKAASTVELYSDFEFAEIEFFPDSAVGFGDIPYPSGTIRFLGRNYSANETYKIWTGTIANSSFKDTFGLSNGIQTANGFMCADNLTITSTQRDSYVSALGSKTENTWTETEIVSHIVSLKFGANVASSLAERLIAQEYCFIAARDGDTVHLVIK